MTLAPLHGLQIAHKGQPYSNLPQCRRFEYEHVTVEQRPYHRPKKTTSDISYLGYPNPAGTFK